MGTLIEGFDTPPAVMMTHNPPYYNDLLDGCGFVKAADVLAYQMSAGELSPRITALAAKLEARAGIHVRPFNKKDFWGEVARVLSIYNSAWTANWGFVPMTDKELHTVAESLKQIYDPRLVFLADNVEGKPVGFSLAVPDINVLLKKINGRLLPTGIFTLLTQAKTIHRARVILMGVHPDYRGRGIDTLFYFRTYATGLAAGYNWAEFSWVLESNTPMNNAALAMGSTVYKKWRLWEKPL
jgi:GNAT superfamily N-acetyltransferase